MSFNGNVAVYGLGTVGEVLCEKMLDRDGFTLSGVVDINPDLVGQDIGHVLDREETGVTITDNHDALHEEHDIDVAFVTTTSFFESVRPVIEDCIRVECDIVSTSEELFYPRPEHRNAADEIDELAKEHGVTVVSQGVNPGFIFDYLPATISGLCHDIDHIHVQRCAIGEEYKTARSRFGQGLPLREYRKRLSNGDIQTHAGMEESMVMLGDSLGVEFDEIKELQEPVLAADDRETPYVEVPEGTVAGLKQQAYGIIDDVAFVSLEVYVGILKPEDKGAPDELEDNIRISGEPNLDVVFDPIIDSLPGTSAHTINMVPVVVNADPGYKHLGELPPATAMVGSVDEFVD